MSSNNNERTFKGLLDEYKIKIPVIQREYAQGRDTPKARAVRRKFIESARKVLLNGEPLNMDFIFGVVEGKEFIPIDGQQRLTFLFLLHLYVYALKGKTDDVKFLKNFSYEIRSSSKEFVEKLVEHIEDFSKFLNEGSTKEEPPSDWIKDQEWFLPGWDRDLTIKSMLKVLDEIHKEFKDKENENEIKIENLNEITFKIVDIRSVGMDEELYIKMNSTGRQLTEFEILKVKFIEFLNAKNVSGRQDFAKKINTKWMNIFWKKFKYKRDNYYEVDNAMLNFFYYMVEMLIYETFDKPKNKSKKDKEKNVQNLSEVIKKFYDYDDNSNKWWKEIPLEDILNECYNWDQLKWEDWFNLLTFTLDNLEDIDEKIEEILSNEYEDGKVAIWEKNPNLLARVIYNNIVKVENIVHKENKSYDKLDLWQQVFLYTFLKAYRKLEEKSKNSSSDENFKDAVHLIRNLIFSVSKSNNIWQSLNIGEENIHELLGFLGKFIGEMHNLKPYESIQYLDDDVIKNTEIGKYRFIQEKQKAKYISNNPNAKQYIQKLENHKYLKGDLTIFMEKVEKNSEMPEFREKFKEDIYEYTEIFYKLFDNKDEDIIPAFLVYIITEYGENFDKMETLKYGGNRVFFGRKGYWGYLLHSIPEDKRDELSKAWWGFLNKIKDNCSDNVCKTLKCIKKNWLRDNNDFYKPEYYFIKYGDFYEDFECLDGTDYNIFAVKFDENGINWFRAEKVKSEKASGHHINPFVYTVAKRISERKSVCNFIASGWDYSNDDHYDTHLVIKGEGEKNGEIFRARIDKEGWKIEVMDDGKFEELRGKGFRIEKPGESTQDGNQTFKYILKPDHRDLIKVMVSLMKELLKAS